MRTKWLLTLWIVCATLAIAQAQMSRNVLTQHNDNSRTGAYLSETVLTPAALRSGRFGKLYERTVEGDILAQPLYVHDVPTSAGVKNLFFIATSTNRVYAFDADSPNTPPIWQRQLQPWRALTGGEICAETTGTVGITSTPVIDPSTRTMYVVTRHSTRVRPGTPDDVALYQLHKDGTIWQYLGTPVEGWQLLDNNQAAIQIAAGGPEIYQLHRDGTIWRYTGVPVRGWQMLDNNPDTMSILATRRSLYQLHRDGTIWIYTGVPMTGWQMLDNNPATVEIVATDTALYQLHNDGTIWRYTGTPHWEMLDNNRATVKIVAAEHGLYQLHNDGTIWRYVGSPSWQLIDTNRATTQITASETSLYQLHNDGAIWRYLGTPVTGWQVLDNNPATVEVLATGTALYQRHNDGTIWRYTGPPMTGWQMLDNNRALTQIAAGVTRKVVVATDKDLYKLRTDGALKHYTRTPLTGWQTLDNNPATWEIAAGNDVLCQLHRDGTLWRYTGKPATPWEMLDSNRATVQIAVDGNSIYQMHDTGKIWHYTGIPSAPWELLDKNPATAFIHAAGGKLFQMHNDGSIWRYTGTPNWELLDNNPKTVQIAAAGGNLYQLHNDGKIWHYTGKPATPWEMLDDNTATIRIVAWGGSLYQLHDDGTIWQYTGSPIWKLIDNNPESVEIAATRNDIYQLHNTGRIWHYTGSPNWQLIDNDHEIDDAQNYLHAIDITNGSERPHSPVHISGSYGGANYDSHCQRNRPGLLLQNGVVYLAFATFSCDQDFPCSLDGNHYRGWVMGYRTRDLAQVGIFCTSPEGAGAGVWQTGNGLVARQDGSIYFETGNETIPSPLGDSFVCLKVVGAPPGLQLASKFRPSNHAILQQGDTDLGSGGPVLLPGSRLIGGGKQGRYYVLDSNTMLPTQNSAPDPSDPRIGEGFQAFFNTWHTGLPIGRYAEGEQFGPNIHGGPVYWSGTSFLYEMPEKDFLKAFHYNAATGIVDTTPAHVANVRPPDGMPGGFSSLSANGNRDGIVWTLFPNGDGQWNKVPGTLVAFDATNLVELWRDCKPGRDCSPVSFAKSCPPTIADGKVFRPTFASEVRFGVLGKVIVYGLLPEGMRQDALAASAGERLTIAQKYNQHDAVRFMLGSPTSEERDVGDAAGGRYRDYQVTLYGAHGHRVSVKPSGGVQEPTCNNPNTEARTVVNSSIYWSRETGAHLVCGEIRKYWLQIGGPAGKMGYPISDESDAPDGKGRISRFQHGEISWEPEPGVLVARRKGG
jgi:hypothetical protein